MSLWKTGTYGACALKPCCGSPLVATRIPHARFNLTWTSMRELKRARVSDCVRCNAACCISGGSSPAVQCQLVCKHKFLTQWGRFAAHLLLTQVNRHIATRHACRTPTFDVFARVYGQIRHARVKARHQFIVCGAGQACSQERSPRVKDATAAVWCSPLTTRRTFSLAGNKGSGVAHAARRMPHFMCNRGGECRTRRDQCSPAYGCERVCV